jgi:prephenate dehydrogenase
MREVMGDISDRLEPGAVVTDTGSTKTRIMAWAAELLPSTVTFVGGHPLAGKTESGPGNASATLFEGARWVIVAPPKGDAQLALETVQGLAAIAGATAMYMDAEEHDAYVAAISHLPLLAATALFRLARSSEAWPELSVLAASGFKDTTRLAGTDEGLSFDIASTNREQLVGWLRRYRAELRDLEEAIDQAEPGEDLLRLFGQANVDYTAFRAGVVGRQEVDARGNAMADIGMTDLLLGGNFAERLRQLRETAAGDDDRGRGEPRR